MDWIDLGKAEAFVRALTPLSESDLPLWAVFTHACHETNFFKWVKADHNYFNFKVKDDLLEWESAAEGITFYMEVLNRKFADAVRCPKCAHCFLWGVRKWNRENDLDALSQFRELMRKRKFLQGEDRIMDIFSRVLKYTPIVDV